MCALIRLQLKPNIKAETPARHRCKPNQHWQVEARLHKTTPGLDETFWVAA
jgi:hypothetical protein